MRILGWGQPTLAEKLEVAQSTVSRIISKGSPDYKTLCEWATKLKCQPWELIKPQDAQSTRVEKEPGNAELLAALAQLQKNEEKLQERIRELEATKSQYQKFVDRCMNGQGWKRD